MNDYQQKKAFFDKLLTIYGRKPVLEALQQKDLDIYKLHLASSNKSGGIVDNILRLAEQRDIPVAYHDKKALSRISRNGKQDQGIAADIQVASHVTLEEFIAQTSDKKAQRLLALDGVTNPQNLGMIIRSAAAGNIDGLLLPAKGCAALSPMVIKASAGTLFRAPIIHTDSLPVALTTLRQKEYQIATLSSHAKQSLFSTVFTEKMVFVLGNETDGVSEEVASVCTLSVKIPMNNGVESLNVAVTSALIAFLQ